MKVYKMTLMFIDFDNLGAKGATDIIENARLPNHIIPGHVMALEERDIGEWDDDHPLNNYKTQIAAFQILFEKPAPDLMLAVLGVQGEREFYDLMQAYRNTPLADQKAVVTAYEAVKTYLRNHRV